MGTRRKFMKQAGSLAALSLAARTDLLAGTGLPTGSDLPATTDLLDGRDLPGATHKAEARTIPRRLEKGDLIGLVTPGSPISQEQLDGAVAKIEGLGFRTTFNESVMDSYGYFAGRDQERADEFMEMFTREDIKGVWCVRGGYGSIRILDLLDFQQIAMHPKPLIGYSDITALITAVYQECGMVTYHGPVGISAFKRFSVKSLERVLMDPRPEYKYPYKREKNSRDNTEFDRYTIKGGQAEGILLGGNISVLDSMIGTRFEPDFQGKIAYLEEIGEKTYRVDKMLFHLLSGTNLKKASGIVLGTMADCTVEDEPSLSLRTALDDLLSPLEMPVSYGLPFGHIDRQITLPTGIRAAFDADRNSLRLLEAPVE